MMILSAGDKSKKRFTGFSKHCTICDCHFTGSLRDANYWYDSLSREEAKGIELLIDCPWCGNHQKILESDLR